MAYGSHTRETARGRPCSIRVKPLRLLRQEDFRAAMQGIVCDAEDERVRDEAPQAYKDLTKVMANQAALTDIVHRCSLNLQPHTALCSAD